MVKLERESLFGNQDLLTIKLLKKASKPLTAKRGELSLQIPNFGWEPFISSTSGFKCGELIDYLQAHSNYYSYMDNLFLEVDLFFEQSKLRNETFSSYTEEHYCERFPYSLGPYDTYHGLSGHNPSYTPDYVVIVLIRDVNPMFFDDYVSRLSTETSFRLSLRGLGVFSFKSLTVEGKSIDRPTDHPGYARDKMMYTLSFKFRLNLISDKEFLLVKRRILDMFLRVTPTSPTDQIPLNKNETRYAHLVEAYKGNTFSDRVTSDLMSFFVNVFEDVPPDNLKVRQLTKGIKERRKREGA